MHPLRLTPELLQPNFSIRLPQTDSQSSPWLLGQQRCISAWQLFQRCKGQHLYLSNFVGFDAEKLVAELDARFPLVECAGSLVAIEGDDGQQLAKYSATEMANAKDNNKIVELQPLQRVKFIDQPVSKKTLIGTIDKQGHYFPGLLASCEVLVLPAEGLADKPSRWGIVKEALKRGYLAFSGSSIKVPVTCKVVVVGDAITYDALHGYDPEFADHISLLAEIQPEWFVDDEQDPDLWAAAANAICRQYSGKSLSDCGLKALTVHASRICEHQKRLSLAWHQLGQLLAQTSGDESVTAAAIETALSSMRHRHNSIQIYSQRNIEEATVRVDTSGERIGQINGLTVVEYLGHSYGEPARITVSVHYGDGEVADIERKSELGGNIHAKGMMILSACLYRIFGQDEPLHLSANIVFEQSYQTIDGDSASLAEYCCLISTIADVPVKQSLALTGAVDQFGNVQAIGGINEKIEGFFHLCRYRGLTGEQGVIVPTANLCQLNLHTDVIAAIEDGQFHLYQADNVEDALALLTGEEVGEANDDNRFDGKTLYGKVQNRLDLMAGGSDAPPSLLTRLAAKIFSRS
ncbi:S16 family serine protease [Ferrimonas lipolytica]|uniref:endopeptidase La n=1 Tax=Ferrimonas lipolytica TaxID=2724191 RepID=A0A6H1UBY3_9GAMM|nr:S16 family serine protease [Ferrimonas lipolytica]QIZ76575.1 AAA family ATPase [Ferrimonas lipolytica]